MNKLEDNLEDFIQKSGLINKLIIKGTLYLNKSDKIKKYSPSYFILGYIGGAMLPSDQRNFEIATGISSKEQTNINSLANIPLSYSYIWGSNEANYLVEKISKSSGTSIENIGLFLTGITILMNSSRIYLNKFKDIQSPDISPIGLTINFTSVTKKIINYITKTYKN